MKDKGTVDLNTFRKGNLIFFEGKRAIIVDDKREGFYTFIEETYNELLSSSSDWFEPVWITSFMPHNLGFQLDQSQQCFVYQHVKLFIDIFVENDQQNLSLEDKNFYMKNGYNLSQKILVKHVHESQNFCELCCGMKLDIGPLLTTTLRSKLDKYNGLSF